MTAILGYIADDNAVSNFKTFFASDGRVIWHTEYGDVIQNDYRKIRRFGNFLVSFNGEVSFFEELVHILISVDSEVSSIHALQNAINSKYDYDEYLRKMHGQSQSYYSNIIIYDLSNKILAHHYAGNVSFNRDLNTYFNFEILENNIIYHFGSYTTFLNKTAESTNAYSIEGTDELLGDSIEVQMKLINDKFSNLEEMVTGVGDLNSFYIVEGKSDGIFNNID